MTNLVYEVYEKLRPMTEAEAVVEMKETLMALREYAEVLAERYKENPEVARSFHRIEHSAVAGSQSLRELSRFLLNEPELADIQIIRADINLDMLHLVAAHYGFEEISDLPTLSFWSHLHRFGENILYWLLELACNSGHTWPNKFWRSRRSMYLSRAALAEHT